MFNVSGHLSIQMRIVRQLGGMREAALLRLCKVSVFTKPQCYAAYGVAVSCWRDR